jgi:glutamate/tyrosine decarboxylase-like PLP-dependent enzyme
MHVPMTRLGGFGDVTARLAELTQVAAPLEPDAGERRRLMNLAVAHVEEFLDEIPHAPTVVPMQGVAEHLAAYGFPDAPRDPKEVLDVVARLVDKPGIATTSPRYLGYIPSGGLFSASVADFLAAASNRYSGQAAVSPGAAGIEHVVVRWLADAVGLGADAGGVLTSGGSAGALTAVVAARDAAGALASASPPPVVYLGDHTHHSFELALRVAGLGSAIVRRLPLDARWRLDVDALNDAVRSDRSSGLRPFLVVGTAGTTNTGSVDPLVRIADVARRNGMWFHVDGAYGGLFALCPEAREVLAGIERADSVVVDPHKTLFLPYGTGAVLVRDRRVLQQAFTHDADYLAPAPSGEPPSPADLGPELTRHFRALRVWLPLQLAGRRAFSAALSEKLLLARHAYERLQRESRIKLGPPPDLSILTFRRASREQNEDQLTAELAADLQRQGRVFLTTTSVGGRLVLRMAIGSFRTHLADVDAAVDAIVEAVGPSSAGPRPLHAADESVTAPVAGGRAGAAAGMQHGHSTRDRLRLEVVAGPADADILSCEASVLGERYGNTREELEKAYGEYSEASAFLAVRQPSGRVVGWARLITPGHLPLKTIADVSLPPWSVDGESAAARAGVDLTRAWDVATLGVRPDLAAGQRSVAAALYHGLIVGSWVNGAEWMLAILDVHVRGLLARVGLVGQALPGTLERPYMGSPSSIPVYANFAQAMRTQRTTAPNHYRNIALGAALSGIVVPALDAFMLPQPVTVDLRETREHLA